MQQDHHTHLIGLLDLAMNPQRGETVVVDFAVKLFNVLGYVPRERLARTRVNFPLLICGETKYARVDVCIIDRSQDEVLLVQEDKEMGNEDPVIAQAQLVADAVAAFDENNINRDALGLPPLVEKVMPGIVMRGTSPEFFKIPVTQTVVAHIRHRTYCYPPVPGPSRRRNEGMKPLDNRYEILKCYEAFKMIVGT